MENNFKWFFFFLSARRPQKYQAQMVPLVSALKVLTKTGLCCCESLPEGEEERNASRVFLLSQHSAVTRKTKIALHTPHTATAEPAHRKHPCKKEREEKKPQNPRPHHDAQTEINSSRLTTSVHKNKTTETLEENMGEILVCNPGMQQQDTKHKAQSKSRSLTG